MCSQPPQRGGVDAAEAGGQQAFQGFGVVRPLERAQVSEQEAHHFVARHRAQAPHFVIDAERAQRLFERRRKRGCAAKKDREIGGPQLASRFDQQPLDLARYVKGFVHAVGLFGNTHSVCSSWLD